MEQIRSPQNASTMVETLLVEQSKTGSIPRCYLVGIGNAIVQRTAKLGAPRLIATLGSSAGIPGMIWPLPAKHGSLKTLLMSMRLAMRRRDQDRIHQSTSQPQNAGKRLGGHSSAKKSTSGGAEKSGVPREGPNL